MRQLIAGLSALLLAAGTLACGEEKADPPATLDAGEETQDGGPAGPLADLRADVNRNGTVDLDDPSEDEGEEGWDSTHGAVFLANLDDDLVACPRSTTVSDVDLAKCHDAADQVLNGADDLLDLAPLMVKPWPEATDDAEGRLELGSPGAAKVRLFKKDAAGGFALYDHLLGRLGAAELRAGVELRVEGLDIVRDAQAWDGFVDVTLKVSAGGQEASDAVRLRVSPVMTFHHGLRVENLYATSIRGDSDSAAFRTDLRAAVAASLVPNPLNELANVPEDDQWTQDFFETGYMSMPAPGGGQHVIRVAYRSANLDNKSSSTNPLRKAGKIVFTKLRGKDFAGIQEFDRSSNLDMDTLNSFGNTETIPPHAKDGVSYPLGRLMRGSVPSYHPDAKMAKLLESQKIQPPVYLDTSWLAVAHVDETISFLPAATPRGWIALVNDARLARQMLLDEVAAGNGAVPMFEGVYWWDWNTDQAYSARVTISEVLADTDVMNESAASAAEVDAQVAILKAETGLTDAEIVKAPFLHQPVDGTSLAYQPGTVNGVLLDEENYVAPETHGPVIGGKDIFKTQLESALAPYGYTVRWVENWALYHAMMGEVHCGSNASREIPETKWWETGR